MSDCQLNVEPGLGQCCCNCEHQMLAMKHPWNTGDAKGSISEVFGALCAVPDMVDADGRRQAVFFETNHGMCEMHEHRAPVRSTQSILEEAWNKFIAHLNEQQPLPGGAEHQSFLGSVKSYRKLFLEANK